MSISVTLDGTEVTKYGSDAECYFHLWLGDGRQAYENLASKNFDFDPIDNDVAAVLKEADVDWKDLKDFAKDLHISFGGNRGYKTDSDGRYFPQGKVKDNSQKFVVGKQKDLVNIVDALNNNASLNPEGSIKFGGKEVFSYKFDRTNDSFEYYITISVTAYTTHTGDLDTSKAAITEFEPSTLRGALEAYEYKGKIEICSGFTNCKAKNKNGETVEQVMNGLGFKFVRDSNGRYESKDEYKITASTLDELGVSKDADGNYGSESNTFFYLFPTKYFCDLATDKLCARFIRISKDECTSCSALQKDEAPGYRMFRDSNNEEQTAPGGCEDNSCKISEGYKKPMYEALAKHLAAAGFTQILPSTFNPVNIEYDPGGGDESEIYTFVGYEMAGEYLERTNIGSKSNVLIDIKDKPVNIFSAKAVKGATTIQRNPDGTLPADYANDLAFATTSEGLQKMVEKNSVHHDKDHVFTETVYFNTVKETVWQMAEVWRQTAMITLNKQNIPYGTRTVYNENIYAVGAVEPQSAYVFGTELDLDRMVFEAYESQASAAGYALNSENLSFNLDLTYSEQGGEGGSKTARGSTSISFKDIIRNYLANHDKSDEERKQNFTDTLTVSLDNFEVDETGDIVYDIEDINVSYSTNLWNNVELDFGFDPFISNKETGKEAWETFEAKATWKIADGKMMILSADAVGRIGLEASWRIDSKDPDTYRGQSQLRKLIAEGFDGAIVAGGMMFDPVTQKATPSLSLSKSFNEAVSTSISLTSASVTAKLKKEYGGEGDWYGQLDIAAQATFGVDYSDFFKGHDPSKINGKDVEELAGKEHSKGSDYEAFKKFARSSLDINYKANLITLGNNFGNIVFSAKTSATLGQANGVIQGITFRSATTFELKWENNVVYNLFGLPANIHPTIGGQVGFSMHKVKSRYFGTEYSGHQFAVGFGVFGLTWELHNRRTVIKQILQRKRYASIFSLFGVLDWEEDKETDEDYIARAWPCLVYNIINWAKEDFKTKKYDPDVAAMKASIFPKNKPPVCEQLKSNTDVGILFSDFYRDTFATGTAGVRFLGLAVATSSFKSFNPFPVFLTASVTGLRSSFNA